MGPRLIVGAIEGKLIVGGAVGSPERGDAPVNSGALSEGGACEVGTLWPGDMAPGKYAGWVAERAEGREVVCRAGIPCG